MNQKAERSQRADAVGPRRGLEALRESSAFRGPVEPLDDHEHTNDHFALIYEDRDDQFDAAIPFVRQGLDAGEQCVYIVDENTRADVLEAMETRGIDVDAALDSGALSVLTEADTYLRNGAFQPDDMIAYLDEVIEDAAEEFEGLRVTGEMSWMFSEEPDIDDLLTYEGELNELLPETDAMVLCQYNRTRFPSDIVRDVIRTHPHLVHDNVISHNVYYTPPEAFFGSEEPANEVDRMMDTLRERSEAKAELEERQQFLREQNEITASQDQSFEEKLQDLFELGCERFDLELGAMARVDTDDDWFEIEHISEDHEHFAPGVELPLSQTYCTAATEIRAAGSVSDPVAEGYDDITVYQEYGIEAYLGTYIEVDGGADRTFFFVTPEPRDESFSDDERVFLQSMGQWVQHELETERRERFLRASYKITSDPARSFEEKLEQLLDLGCERFDLEMAGLNHLPSWDGSFRLEKGVGLDLDATDEPLWTDPGKACFCRETITADSPVSRADVRGTDWAEDSIHEQFGLTSYLGTKVTSGSTPYGTLWFGSTEPRDRQFSDAEETFIELIGQWVSYEIDQRKQKRDQQTLYEIASDTDRTFEEKLQDLFELGCERFDLELGGLARIDPDSDFFEVEAVSGDHEHLVPGAAVELSETYCRVLDDAGETADVTDPVADGFDGTLAHDEFGVNAYLGTRIGLDDGLDRSLFFVSSEPKEASFSEAERTFQHLMGQWVEYELERKQHEQELREREQYLRALVETTPECIKTVGEDGTLLQMNPAGLEMVEADAEEDVIGGCVYNLIAPEHRKSFREFNERICGGESGTMEFDIVGLDGTRRHMETHAAPLRRPDGSTAHVALTRDVTEQKAREAELRQTKNRFETVFEQSDDGIFVLDPDEDELVDANPAAAKMTGYAHAELLSLGPSDLHPGELEQFSAFLAETRETGSAWRADLHCRHKDGHDIPAEITASTITLDGRELILALVRDVSERKTHERYQRELYEITADTELPTDEKIDRLIDVGRDRLDLPVGMLTQERESAFEIEHMRGTHPDLDVGTLTPELTDNYCRQVVETGESVGVADAEAAGWDEDALYFEFDLQCYAGTQVIVGGDVYGTVCFANTSPREPFTDTEQSFLDLLGQCIRYELERKQYEEELEGTIDRLQQSNDRLKQFAYAASHDLQEPLRMVSSYLQLLENRYEGELDEDAEEYIDFAVDGADRMREMVDDLLAYSRVEQSDGEFERVDCDDVVERVLADLQLQVEENDATVVVDDLPTVVADADQLEQLFRNLVSNAIKYSGDEPPHVEITAERHSNCWEFAVADDGIGIDPAQTDRIFEVFKRLHHDDEYSGTGIGLSLCQEIVENHGGDIRVESDPGEGSTFFVTLPEETTA